MKLSLHLETAVVYSSVQQPSFLSKLGDVVYQPYRCTTLYSAAVHLGITDRVGAYRAGALTEHHLQGLRHLQQATNRLRLGIGLGSKLSGETQSKVKCALARVYLVGSSVPHQNLVVWCQSRRIRTNFFTTGRVECSTPKPTSLVSVKAN